MLTGRWPHRNGAEGFEPIHDGVPLLTELLHAADYRCGILGKVEHLAPVERFGWDFQRGQRDLGMGRDPAAYGAATAAFLAQSADRPWFLMANAHDPHRPFHGSDDERQRYTDEQRRQIPLPSKEFTADHVTTPGFLPDLPVVRREIAEYLGSVRRCDDVVRAVLDALTASGQADRTLVVFLSDNGMAFPFAKANCYLHSTRTPLIVRWPGHTAAGAVDDRHFVSGLDLFPTFCAVAGVQSPADIDGRSLCGLLDGGTEDDRDYLVTVFHETSAKRRYEMRCVHDGNHGYIWNAWADGESSYRAENMHGRTWPAMVEDGSPRVDFYLRRTPEELYDLSADPHALHNLAADQAHRGRLESVRARLRSWMVDVGDPLAGSGRWP